MSEPPRSLRPPASAAAAPPSFSDRATYRRRRAGDDLYGRANVGPLFYALGCMVTAGVGGYFQPPRWPIVASAVLFVALFFLRRTNRPPPDAADAGAHMRWRDRHWVMIHIGCALWSALFVHVGYLEADYRPAVVIAAISTVAFGTASSQAFAMDARHATLTLTILYLPALAWFTFGAPGLRPIAITLGVYGLYLLASLRRSSREYEAQIETEYALLLSKAEVERLTRLDALTTLANRREYDKAFPRSWHQAARLRGDHALLVLDIDHFKDVNDRYGHLAGDACLQHFARLLSKHFRRDADQLSRIGGEEFVVVLPGTPLDHAADLAEKFRADLAATPCTWDGQSIHLTVSIGAGVADWEKDTSPDATFARVDRACYLAKDRGRDRVVRTDEAAADS